MKPPGLNRGRFRAKRPKAVQRRERRHRRQIVWRVLDVVMPTLMDRLRDAISDKITRTFWDEHHNESGHLSQPSGGGMCPPGQRGDVPRARPDSQHGRDGPNVADRRTYNRQGGADLMPIEPLGSRVVLRRTDAESVTPGGIVLPEAAKEKPREGVVLAVGPGKRPEAAWLSSEAWASPPRPAVHVGDRVLFATYAGTEVKVDGETVLIVDEDDILAVIR